MSEEQREEQVRAIAHEVLAEVSPKGVYPAGSGHWGVSHELLNEDTGELLPRMLASTRGDVMRPALAAKLGLSAQVEELARRLGALGEQIGSAGLPWEKQVRAIAREVMEGSGEDGVASLDDEGHWRVGVEAFDEERWELRFQVLATTRGDVPMPLLAAKLGLSARAEELARRLGALGVKPEDALLDEEEVALIPKALEGLRHLLKLGVLPLPEIPAAALEGGWVELGDPGVIRKVMKEFVQDVRAHLEEEKGWPEVLEADRLEAAFEELYEAGIVAEMGAANTLSSGWSSVRELAQAQRDRGLDPWGAAFFHEQDIESAVEGSSLHIAFGELGEEPSEKDVRVGQAVVEALRKHGFEPSWNGSAGTRIEVLPRFTWRRRRSRIDTIEHLSMGTFPAALVELLPRLRTLWLRAEDMYLQDLAEMRSDSVEELTLEYRSEWEAREALPDVMTRVRGRFPRLQALIIQVDHSFLETIEFPE